MSYEPDGVGQRVSAAIGGLRTSNRRVEGGEELVLDEYARAGQPVEQRGFAGVRVAGNRDRRHLAALALLPFHIACGRHVRDLSPQLRHPRADPTPIGFDLRLTWAAATDTHATSRLPTRLARQRLTPTAQSRQQVGHLGQLDLRLALFATRVLREDIEDQRGAVDDFDLHYFFQLAQLTGRELAIADHRVGAGR